MRISVHTMGPWCGLRMPWSLKELGLLEEGAVDDEDDGAENERGDDEATSRRGPETFRRSVRFAENAATPSLAGHGFPNRAVRGPHVARRV